MVTSSYEAFCGNFDIAQNPKTREQVVSNFMVWFNEVASACHREARCSRPIAGYLGRLCFRVCMMYVGDFDDSIPQTAGVFKTSEDHAYIGSLMRDELNKRPHKDLHSSANYFIIFTFRTRSGRVEEAVLTGAYDIPTPEMCISSIKDIFYAPKKHVKVSMTNDERSEIFAKYHLISLKSLAAKSF